MVGGGCNPGLTCVAEVCEDSGDKVKSAGTLPSPLSFAVASLLAVLFALLF